VPEVKEPKAKLCIFTNLTRMKQKLSDKKTTNGLALLVVFYGVLFNVFLDQ
jgi:hypothetical protein